MRRARAVRLIAFAVGAFACVIVPACTPPQKDASFSIFWTDFRAAVTGRDLAKLTALARFPFEVRGPADADPVWRYDREQFASVANQLLNESVRVYDGSKTVETPMAAVITNRPSANDALIAEGQARIETFVFNKVGTTWLWTRAYSDEWEQLPKPAH